MSEASPLVAIIVIGIGLAFLFGTIAHRFKFSPLVGYLLAGVAVGPFTPGFVADTSLAPQLTDIGVILLMFGVGLHFSVKDLLSVWKVVVPSALAQIAVSAGLGFLVANLMGWPPQTGIVFGLALSVASTVVLMRALQERRLMETERGHIAVGWLVVQDMFTVIALVMLPPLAGALKPDAHAGGFDVGALVSAFGFTLLNLVLFVGLMLVVGGRVIPVVLHYVAHTGSRELFRLAVLAVALTVAFVASELFGVSLALGAFLAGMILSESPLSQRAAEESLPLRDAFAVLFFVSIGMLFDPTVIIHQPVPLLATLLVVMLGNGGVAFLMMRFFGYTVGSALVIAAGLAQIGEFSFILADIGISLGLVNENTRDVILGASIISILVNPLLFAGLEALRPWIAPATQGGVQAPPGKIAEEPIAMTDLTNHAILVGYGRVGRLLGESLRNDGWPLLVIEDATDVVEHLQAEGIPTIRGNAAQFRVLHAAGLVHARVLLVAIPDGFEAGRVVEQARSTNPDIQIIARAHFDGEVEHLLQHGANTVIMGEREIAHAMLEHARAFAPV